MKLSKAQRSLLELLNQGDKLHFIEGIDSFWSISEKTINYKTVHNLLKYCYIEETSTIFGKRIAFITPRGEDFLNKNS